MSAYVPDSGDAIFVAQFWHCTKQDFENVGFQFHEQVQLPNGIGMRATLPRGWSKRRLNDYQVDLFDEWGNDRVIVGDDVENPWHRENGGVYLNSRFYVWDSLGEPEFDEKGLFARVRMNTGDHPVTLYETEAVSPKDLEPLNYNGRREWDRLFKDECEAWLDARYPNWRDRTAYWEGRQPPDAKPLD